MSSEPTPTLDGDGPNFRAEEEAAVRASALDTWRTLEPGQPADTMPPEMLTDTALDRLVEYRSRLEIADLMRWALMAGWELHPVAHSLCKVLPSGDHQVTWRWRPRSGPGSEYGIYVPADSEGLPTLSPELVERIRAQRQAAAR